MSDAPASDGEQWARTFALTDVHRDLGLYCAGAGRTTGAARRVDERVLPCYGAVLVEAGAGWFDSPRLRRRRRIEGPALLWLFPGILHSYRAVGPGWIESWILFGGTAARSYEQLGYLRPEAPVQGPEHLGATIETFSRLFRRCADRSRREGEATALLHRLITEAGAARRESPASAPSLVERLRAQACMALSIQEHARRLDVTVEDLRAAVRAVGVDGPKELVLQARMSRAMTLLAESSLPVATVAAEVGYEDPAYFSRLFARRVGIPPSLFRRRRRAAAGWRLRLEAASAAPAARPLLRPRIPAGR